MGLFGFIGEVASAAVKVAVTPVVIVKDAADILQGGEGGSTSDLIDSIGDDLENGIDELTGEI